MPQVLLENRTTQPCFACGKAKDDLYHFLRCPYVAFIFCLPKMFGSIKKSYFSPANLSRIASFFEVYYLLTRQYGLHILPFPYEDVAHKASVLAKHVAIKNKIQFLARIPQLYDSQISAFVLSQHSMHKCTHMYGCLDIVDM